MRVLSDADVAAVVDLEALLPVVADAFRKQGAGQVERPDRPHVPVGHGLNHDRRTDADPASIEKPMGTGLVMPSYIHGSPYFVVKIVGVNEGNVARGLPTVNATIAVTAADTGLPVGYMAGTRVTNARTGCIGGLATRELAAEGPVTIGVIGAGAQARWQVRAIDAAITVDSVDVYSPSDSRERCAADLRDHGIDATAVTTPATAVRDASVVVTATTATEPVFDGTGLKPGTLVIAVGAYTESMRELDENTIERATHLFADVPAEAANTGDFPHHEPADLLPFSAVLASEAGRSDAEEIIVVKSVGTAVLDAATAEFVLDRAAAAEIGTIVDL